LYINLEQQICIWNKNKYEWSIANFLIHISDQDFTWEYKNLAFYQKFDPQEVINTTLDILNQINSPNWLTVKWEKIAVSSTKQIFATKWDNVRDPQIIDKVIAKLNWATNSSNTRQALISRLKESKSEATQLASN
jgi:hypothetical protein